MLITRAMANEKSREQTSNGLLACIPSLWHSFRREGVIKQNESLHEMLGKGKLHRRGESHSCGKYNIKSTHVNHDKCKTVKRLTLYVKGDTQDILGKRNGNEQGRP